MERYNLHRSEKEAYRGDLTLANTLGASEARERLHASRELVNRATSTGLLLCSRITNPREPSRFIPLRYSEAYIAALNNRPSDEMKITAWRNFAYSIEAGNIVQDVVRHHEARVHRLSVQGHLGLAAITQLTGLSPEWLTKSPTGHTFLENLDYSNGWIPTTTYLDRLQWRHVWAPDKSGRVKLVETDKKETESQPVEFYDTRLAINALGMPRQALNRAVNSGYMLAQRITFDDSSPRAGSDYRYPVPYVKAVEHLLIRERATRFDRAEIMDRIAEASGGFVYDLISQFESSVWQHADRDGKLRVTTAAKLISMEPATLYNRGNYQDFRGPDGIDARRLIGATAWHHMTLGKLSGVPRSHWGHK